MKQKKVICNRGMIYDTEKLLGTQFGKMIRFRKEMGNSHLALGNVQAKNWELLFWEKC